MNKIHIYKGFPVENTLGAGKCRVGSNVGPIKRLLQIKNRGHRRQQSRELQELVLPPNWQKIFEATILELWNLVEHFQNPRKCLLKKGLLNFSECHWYSIYHPPAPSSMASSCGETVAQNPVAACWCYGGQQGLCRPEIKVMCFDHCFRLLRSWHRGWPLFEPPWLK